MLRFQLLGPLQAWRGSQPIPHEAWRTRQTLAVFKILLGDRGQPIPFERLIDLVWQEADALSRAWARAAVQAGHFLLVRGSAGMGKTRLTEQFAQRLGPGVGVLWMAAHEPEVELPFAPVLGLLGNWLERSATPALVRRLGPHAPVLAHLLPQVRAIWPEGPALRSAGPEPSQVLEALTAAVRLLSGAEQTLIVIEDLHWCDPSTVLWLDYALRRLPAGTLVMGTHRTEEGTSEPLEQLLQSLRRLCRLAEVELKALTRYEVDGLVATGAPPLDRSGYNGPSPFPGGHHGRHSAPESAPRGRWPMLRRGHRPWLLQRDGLPRRDRGHAPALHLRHRRGGGAEPFHLRSGAGVPAGGLHRQA